MPATSTSLPPSLDRRERALFPRELARIAERLGIDGGLSRRAAADFLIVYRRLESDQTEFLRLFRPASRLIADEWADAVIGPGTVPTQRHADILLLLAARGLERSALSTLNQAWGRGPGFREPGLLIRRAPLAVVREYIDYLANYAPYLPQGTLGLARRLILSRTDLVSAELAAEFISLYYPAYVARFAGSGVEIGDESPQWPAWFEVYLQHSIKAASLPESYLETPFAEVVRNIPLHVWYDVSVHPRRGVWSFAIGTPGFLALAAGTSARAQMRTIGLPRAAWRAYVALPVDFLLSDLDRPNTFVWALGLSRNIDLAREVAAFVPANGRESWTPIVQQLARLDYADWRHEGGQRLLGYVYHMVRDQPGFRINVRHREAFFAAARAHYERIQNTFAAIEQRRQERIDVERGRMRREAERAAEQARLARVRLEAYYRASKWKRMSELYGYGRPGANPRILELTSGWELYLEGRFMSNCVANYTASCLTRVHAICSLRRVCTRGKETRVTIRINQKARRIVEARGRFNREPDLQDELFIKKWARENRIAWK